MKVKFTPSINYWSGKNDDFVYSPSPNRQYSICRSFTYPKLTTYNHQKGSIMKNLALLWSLASSDYNADLATYTQRYLTEHSGAGDLPFPCHSKFGWFVHMFFRWYRSDPTHIDLETVTIADVVALDADVYTIRKAVEAGFLPMISLYEDLTSSIQ